jgi:serralysin
MRARLLALLAVLLLVPLSASARFHLWQITEIYSNANGTVQFVEAEVVNPTDNENLTASKSLSSNSVSFTMPTDLATTTTTHFLLFATPAFVSQPGCTNVTPDFTLAGPNFMSTVAADLINFANVNNFSYTAGELPTDGVNSLNEPYNSNVRTTAANSPTNYAGQTCQLPEPSGAFALFAGAALVLALRHVRKSGYARARLGV